MQAEYLRSVSLHGITRNEKDNDLDKETFMRLSITFSRTCLFWMLFSQAVSVLCLYSESDWDNLSDAPLLTRICPNLLALTMMGILVLLPLGIVLIFIHAVKKHRLEPNTAWELSGVVYVILALVGSITIIQSMPDLYGPPPGLVQYVRLGIVVALDVVVGIAIRQLIVAGNRPRISPSCE